MQGIVERFIRVRRYAKDGVRSMHKPLLQLLALSAFTKSGTSRLAYDSTKPTFERLLKEYGPPADKHHLEYPFKFMANDGIWVAHLSDGSVVNNDTRGTQLQGSTGQFSADVEAALLADSNLAPFLARAVADYCLPTELATELLDALDLLPSGGSVIQFEFAKQGRKRNAQWRGKIIAAWKGRCAFCGYDGNLNDTPVALDAAHIRWFNHDGPDDMNNGLALCVLDHRLFDRGALALTTELHVEVSPRFQSTAAIAQRIHQLHGNELAVPSEECRPHNDYIDWHRSQVFKAS